MIREPFRPGRTALHRADVRAKLVAVGILVGLTAVLQTTTAAWAALAMGLSALTLTRITLAETLRRLVPANVLFLLLTASLSLTYPGSSWETWPAVSIDGAHLGLRIAVKGNAALCLLLALASSSSVAAMADGLDRLGLPRKLVLLLAFSYRQIFITAAEWERRRQAMAARCFTPGMSLHTYRTLGTLFGQTLLGSLDRAGRIRDAMQARCFDGLFHVLEAPEQHSRPETAAMILGALICATGHIALHRGWI